MADANPVVQVATQLKQLWGKQSKRRRAVAIVAVLGIGAIVAVATLTNHGERWTAIEASPDDTAELYSVLSARGLPVRMTAGKVEVANDRIDEARAIAGAAGLPHTGKGFELFDGNSLGQSSFAEQVNYRRALQGELARSIATLAQVQSARVHLALGKRSVFKDQDEPASASVALQLHAGQTLIAEQVRGVRQLVAASLEGLKPEAVVVLDQHGNLLDGAAPGAQDKKADLERTLTSRVRSMLEKVVGTGKVSVVTTAVVDERKLSETQDVYDQTAPVLRSESRTIEGDPPTANIGGVAGTRGNLPGAPVAGPAQGSGATGRLQETKNYEVNHTVRQVVKPEVQLQKLHVAVLVDEKVGPDGKPIKRTEAELGELVAVARQAAGIDDSRGDKLELRSIPFAADPDAEPAQVAAAPAELPLMWIAIGGGAFVLLVMVAMLMRGRKKAAVRTKSVQLALPVKIEELERVLEAQEASTGEPAMELPTAPERPALPPGRLVRDRVLEIVRGDAERAAEVLTAWLSEQPKGAKP